MNFIDTAWINVKAGDGGAGHISFRREKYVPKGGPDGGNGGNGGSIIIEADRQLGTLLDFTYQRHYKAEPGARGGSSNCTGKSGKDVIIRVPTGTVITDKETGDHIVDLTEDGARFVVAQGGRGGRGNSEFVTSVNQAPRMADTGTPGEERTISMELKLLADVGLVGFPNAGKSTLIASISAARPKIADYPFTTLVPNLGLVRAGEYRSFTVADIPGLIEGAHEGKGLGTQFLRHIERTAVLLFLIDVASEDPEKDLSILQNELGRHSAALLEKPALIRLTKSDTCTAEERAGLEQSPFIARHSAKLISAVAQEGTADLIRDLWPFVEKQRATREIGTGLVD